ncbi:hypothetical protein [Paenibacillus dendritiformis]|uniref:hypothetical protein n=1 Tax=Paenibacillus dendritiformis TaxID=130049 RepID=UPI0018CE307E|nr:hypothetical protein [Paenibacillus dendritiformis]
MRWKHVVVEGYCFYENTGNSLKPHCCKYNPGDVGAHCLSYDETEKKICPYFGFGTARTSLVLTGDDGEAITAAVFNPEKSIGDAKEWLRKEKDWINKWKKKVSEEQFD